MSDSPCRAFISYSHDDESHEKRVLALSERLRADGIDVELDRYVEGSPEEGWPRWMLNQIDRADRVLVVCTETYYRRFRGHELPSVGKGVDWEGAQITHRIYAARSKTRKFVPVLFAPSDEKWIPDPLGGQTFYLLDEAGYARLYDLLVGRAGVERSPLGDIRHEPRHRGDAATFGDDAAGNERVRVLDVAFWVSVIAITAGAVAAFARNALSAEARPIAIAAAVSAPLLGAFTKWATVRMATHARAPAFVRALAQSRFRAIAAIACGVAATFFWTKAIRVTYVFLDCDFPRPAGLSVVVGAQDRTEACDAKGAWLDSAEAFRARAPGYDDLTSSALRDLPVDARGQYLVHLKRSPKIRCSAIERPAPREMRCNGPGREGWKVVRSWDIHLELLDDVNATDAIFLLESRDPKHDGVDFAGLGGSVVLPGSPSEARARAQTTSSGVTTGSSGRKQVNLVAFICTTRDDQVGELVDLASMRVQLRGADGTIDLVCST